MSEFKREDRYIVIKRSDLDEARAVLTKGDLNTFDYLLSAVAVSRKRRGKSPLQCVVIESDWPEYEPTWKAIEDRMRPR